MKLKTAAVIAFVELIVLSIAVSAQARIGWTLEECIQHYGPDTPVDGADKNGNAVTWHTFNVHGWDITVVAFKNGKVADITYEKPTEDRFTLAEIRDLLAKNGGDFGHDKVHEVTIKGEHSYSIETPNGQLLHGVLVQHRQGDWTFEISLSGNGVNNSTEGL
jgi:hypothetical protein